MAPELGDTDLHAVTPSHPPAEPVVHAAPPGGLELDAPDGPHLLDAPTVDSDADGVADTTVTSDPAVGAGVLGLATDLDHDGDVDVLTTLDPAGVAHTVTVPDAPHPTPDPWDEGVAPPPPVLDPADGRWRQAPDPARAVEIPRPDRRE